MREPKTKTPQLPAVRELDGPAPRELGWFLKFCREHESDPEGIVLDVPLNSEGELMQRAAERVFLPKKVRLLEAQVKTLKKGKSTENRCRLWGLVILAKMACLKRGRTWDHAKLAQWVDKGPAKKGGLRAVCPPDWLELGIQPFPRTVTEALSHPVLKKRLRTLISQAK